MERNAQKNGFVNVLMLLVAAAAGYLVARYSHVLAGQVSALIAALGFLAASVSWFQMRLAARERLEQLEFEEITRTAGANAPLFDSTEAENFPARRARQQFEKYFVPAFSTVLFVLQAAGAWWLWQWLRKQEPAGMTQPLVAMALLGMVGLVLFLVGKYSAGIARLQEQYLLRPGASYLLLGAYLYWLSVAGIIAFETGYAAIDYYVALALCAVLALMAVETALTLLLEIYRPRVAGKTERVLYESRLVGLLSQPENLFTTAAHALDYQFGFKVSETWFYRFLERAFIWLVLAQAAILLLSTCFVFVNPGEQALLERFGTPVRGRELLNPGAHLKFPWPVDRVYRHTNEAVQTFVVGFRHDDEHEEDEKGAHSETLLWTVSHAKEEFRLLVASRESADSGSGSTNSAAGKRSPPVSLLAANIPVQYQISDLRSWAYNHRDAEDLLEKIGTREVVRYLVSVDFNEVTSTGRFQAAEDLRARIQKAADQHQLGVKVLFVGFADCHPPVQVAKSYEEVGGARQKREAAVLAAQAHQVQTNALSETLALQLRHAAEAERKRSEVSALARASLFTNQIPTFQAAPSVYATRAYLQTFANGARGARKYILLSTNAQDVYTLNFEDKLRPDLGDLPMPASKPK